MKKRICKLLMASILTFISLGLFAQSEELKRPPRIDDRLYDERFGLPLSSAISDEWSVAAGEGGTRAFTVNRALITRKHTEKVGGDVFVELDGQPPINITNGIGDNSEWIFPIWSPDKSKLLMLGTRGGYRTLWMWDRATKQLQQLSKRGMVNKFFQYYSWIDDTRVLCITLPEGVLPEDADAYWDFVPNAMAPLLAGWKNRFEDKESSVSVVRAGVSEELNFSTLEKRQMLLIDTATKAVTAVSEVFRAPSGSSVLNRQAFPSPDNQFVAFYRYITPPPGGMAFNFNAATSPGILELRRLDGKPLTLDKALPQPPAFQTLRWSLDGKELMYFVWEKVDAIPKLVIVNPGTGRVEMPSLGKLDVRPSPYNHMSPIRNEWTEQGDIIVLVMRPERIEQAEAYAQAGEAGYAGSKPIKAADWWLLPRTGGQPKVLTGGMKRVPNLTRYSINGPLIGGLDGEVLRLEPDLKLKNLTESFVPKLMEPKGRTIVWPKSDGDAELLNPRMYPLVPHEERPRNHRVIVAEDKIVPAVGEKSAQLLYTYYRLDTQTGTITKLQSPKPEAVLATVDGEVETAFYTIQSNGEKVETWRDAIPGGQPKLVHTMNAWRKIVAAPETGDFFDTAGAQGQPQKHIFYRPIAYEKGKRYPLIVSVYPGTDYSKGVSPTRPVMYEERTMGYGVLTPSATARPGRRYHLTALDVMPAVEKVVELGIADPDRLVIEGFSGGGWMTMAIVTQTNRFKAAISMSGTSDIGSGDGTFNVVTRYKENPRPFRHGEWLGPQPQKYFPWENRTLYESNSPLTYVDRMETPIMLLTGDMDYIDMTQSEQFFEALRKLNKRTDLVRYWGLGHGQPHTYSGEHVNGKDWFIRHVSWYDEFCDITRDDLGNPVWDGNRMKSRGGKPPLKFEDYEKFDILGKGGPDSQFGAKSAASSL